MEKGGDINMVTGAPSTKEWLLMTGKKLTPCEDFLWTMSEMEPEGDFDMDEAMSRLDALCQEGAVRRVFVREPSGYVIGWSKREDRSAAAFMLGLRDCFERYHATAACYEDQKGGMHWLTEAA